MTTRLFALAFAVLAFSTSAHAVLSDSEKQAIDKFMNKNSKTADSCSVYSAPLTAVLGIANEKLVTLEEGISRAEDGVKTRLPILLEAVVLLRTMGQGMDLLIKEQVDPYKDAGFDRWLFNQVRPQCCQLVKSPIIAERMIGIMSEGSGPSPLPTGPMGRRRFPGGPGKFGPGGPGPRGGPRGGGPGGGGPGGGGPGGPNN